MTKRMVLVSALRRSGTTALWQGFRGMPDLAAFDEPLHPRLAEGARSNPKGTWPELAAFLDKGDATPIGIIPEAELSSTPSSAEQRWMGQLSRAAPRVAMDVVRGWNRLPALHPAPQEVLYVSLIRDPASWVTGHLRPSGRGTWRKQVMDVWRQASFFTRKGFYDNYHYETIVDAALSCDHPLWGAVRMPVNELRCAPAYVKLLAFWWGVNLATHQSLKDAGVDWMTLTLGEFSTAPKQEMARILKAAGWHDLKPDLSHVTGTRSSHGQANSAWDRAAQRLGIPTSLFTPGGAHAAALEAAFDSALLDGRSAR